MERRAALVLALLVVAAAPSAADFCREEALAGADAGPGAYARRSGGYCDGAVYQEHAGEGELPVIGVRAAPIQGSPRDRAVRLTTIPLSANQNGIKWPLQLQGVAKSPEANYRLDAALSAGSPLSIGPESAMLKIGAGLRAEEVAWVAWSDTSRDGRTFVPLVMPGVSGGDVEVTVRPTIPVAYLLYSVKDPKGAVIAPEASIDGDPDPRKRGIPMTLVVRAGRPELVIVTVIAVGYNGGTQTVSLRLIRPSEKRR